MMEWAPWAFFAVGVFAVWCVVFLKTESFRKATLVALLVGKTYATVYALAGVDRTVVTLYVYPRVNPLLYKEIRITCCMIIWLALLCAFTFTLFLPQILEQLPREVKSLLRELE